MKTFTFFCFFTFVLCLLLTHTQCYSVSTSLFSSVSHLRMLVKIEAVLYNSLESFKNDSDVYLPYVIAIVTDTIKSQVPEAILNNKSPIEEFYYQNDNTPEATYLNHPVNAYQILERFLYIWNIILFGGNTTDYQQVLADRLKEAIAHEKYIWPERSDIEGIQDGLIRLKEFSNLTVESFVQDTFYNYSSSTAAAQQALLKPMKKMTLNQVFDIGKRAYQRGLIKEAYEWFEYVAESVEKNSTDFVQTNSLYDYIAWCLYDMGLLEEAISIKMSLMESEPEEKRHLINLMYFYNMKKYNVENDVDPTLKHSKATLVRRLLQNENNRKELRQMLADLDDDENFYPTEMDLAKVLCKEKTLFDEDKQYSFDSDLKCFLRFGLNGYSPVPYKIERIYSSPEVLVFREFLTSKQSEKLKYISAPKLARATVHNPVTGELEHAAYRISKSSWHSPEEDPVVKEVFESVQDITGLFLKDSEVLQIQNYGIGGYYDAHYDFATKRQKNHRLDERGNRIATALIYMSDVELGGETGFTRLGVTVKPVMGDVLFWRNLHKDGTGDARTKHIACPVIIGTKWVGNHWIREKGQEVRESCDLHPQNGI